MKQTSKPISSPSRTEPFPPPLMSFIRADAVNRSKIGRSRSSPTIFIRKKNVAIETQEPSSPKVTCMGQVHASKRSTAATAARCRWIRSALDFNRRHCRTFWNRMAALFRRNREIKQRSSMSELEDSEKDEEKEGVGDAIFASTVLSPPKNALILTRCRSASNRSLSYGNRYQNSAITRDVEDKHDEEKKTKLGNRNRSGKEIEPRNSDRVLKNLENSNGCEDSKSENSKESKIEENSKLKRNVILRRSRSEPGRIADKL